MPQLTTTDVDQNFPFLRLAGRDVKEEVIQHVSIKPFPAGQFICWEGDECGHLAIVLSGVVRVYKIGESGREITLYRIEKNDSCILTASCILSQIKFPALAVVEQEARAALIPAYILRKWIEHFDVWREYVFGLMSKRLADVIATIEEITFRRVDVRIAELLLKLTEQQNYIAITHQDIASELGTAREVVSRILKDFEREGIISLSRGAITLQNKQALLKKIQIS